MCPRDCACWPAAPFSPLEITLLASLQGCVRLDKSLDDLAEAVVGVIRCYKHLVPWRRLGHLLSVPFYRFRGGHKVIVTLLHVFEAGTHEGVLTTLLTCRVCPKAGWTYVQDPWNSSWFPHRHPGRISTSWRDSATHSALVSFDQRPLGRLFMAFGVDPRCWCDCATRHLPACKEAHLALQWLKWSRMPRCRKRWLARVCIKYF